MVCRKRLCGFIFGVILSIFSGQSTADESGLRVWWMDYGSAYRLAEKEQKPLLVVFDSVDGPERMLKRSSPWQLSNASSASSLFGPYILCRIDISTPSGRELARKFAVPGFPSVVITDKRLNRVIYRRHGPLSDLDWAVMLVSYRTGERLPELSSQPSDQRTVCYT